MTSRRSFLAAILALLGWKPETPDQRLERIRAKIRRAVAETKFQPPLPRDVTMRPVSQVFPDNTYVIIVDNNRINLWPTLGGPDKC